jgi:hypothetical protein
MEAGGEVRILRVPGQVHVPKNTPEWKLKNSPESGFSAYNVKYIFKNTPE